MISYGWVEFSPTLIQDNSLINDKYNIKIIIKAHLIF